MPLKILFVHQNFPGQFKHLAPALVASGHEVTALAIRQGGEIRWNGVRLLPYRPRRGSTPGIHPWVTDFETKVIRGEACLAAARRLASQGYAPDVIIAHPGWGESLFLKELWPHARLGIYAEYFHRQGGDADFDPEFPVDSLELACRLRIKNLNMSLHLDAADALLSPTSWQADSFPERHRERISVIHEGIDTDALRPDLQARFDLGNGRSVGRSDEVLTFVSRNLEPYRGYHIFMRALPRLLAARPRLSVIIVGGEGSSYGPPPVGGGTWRQHFVDEVRPLVKDDAWARVHFLGRIPYASYCRLLQVSSVHAYLTYPFVLSWSLLEAMSTGCTLVASDTGPVREVITDDQHGRLVDFFDHERLANQVASLLEDDATRARLSREARRRAVENFDLRSICLPMQMAWVDVLAENASGRAVQA